MVELLEESTIKLCSWCKQPLLNNEEYIHQDCRMDADAEIRGMFDDGESSWDYYYNR